MTARATYDGPSLRAVVVQAVGGLLVLLGAVVFWLPIPLGAVMMATGIFLLIGRNRPFARWLRRRRSRSQGLNRFFDAIEARAPDSVREVLEITDPNGPCRLGKALSDSDPDEGAAL